MGVEGNQVFPSTSTCLYFQINSGFSHTPMAPLRGIVGPGSQDIRPGDIYVHVRAFPCISLHFLAFPCISLHFHAFPPPAEISICTQYAHQTRSRGAWGEGGGCAPPPPRVPGYITMAPLGGILGPGSQDVSPWPPWGDPLVYPCISRDFDFLPWNPRGWRSEGISIPPRGTVGVSESPVYLNP